MSNKPPPNFPTFTDGYRPPVSGAIGPTPMFPPPPAGPQPSGAPAPPISAGVTPPVSGSNPASSPAPAPALAPQKNYEETVRDRAWALLDGTRWTVEAWFQEANALITDLKTETATGKQADPSADEGKAWLALQPALEHMLANGDASHTRAWVEEVCLAWWDTMTSAQLAQGLSPKKSYRAMAAYILARHKLAVGDRGGALRWAALAHAADKLAEHPGGGGAEVVLKFGLGVPASSVADLEKTAAEQLKAAAGNWKVPTAFPEMVLTKTLALPQGSALVAPILTPSTHPCHPFVASLIPWIDEKGITNEEKGARLEWATAYLTGTLPGVWAQLDFNAMGFACEHDVVGLQRGSNIYGLPGDAQAILIECKNWESEVRSAETGYFLARMKYVGARLGVLVAKSDITGTKDDEAKNAFRFLQGFCLREGVVCLVVTGADLRELAKRGTFAELLDARYRSMTYGSLAKA